jgi:phosphatidylglycerophosphatase A
LKLKKEIEPRPNEIPGGFWVKALASFFYSGYLPSAPGTWASGITAIILFFIWPLYWPIQFLLTMAVYLIGVEISSRAERYYGHDDSRIVIDEVAGQMMALFMVPKMIVPFAMAFFLFRFFDIFKPPPARTWESLRGGWGVMSDDIAAGAYASVATHFLLALLNRWEVIYV